MTSNPDTGHDHDEEANVDGHGEGEGVKKDIQKEVTFWRQLFNAVLTGDRNKTFAQSRKETGEVMGKWLMETPIKIAELFNKNLPIRNAFWQRLDPTHPKFWMKEAVGSGGHGHGDHSKGDGHGKSSGSAH